MILLLNKTAPIHFHRRSHELRRWVANRFIMRGGSSRFSGPQIVAENVRQELAEEKTIYWEQSFWDCPQNPSIDTVWVVSGARNLRWAIRNKGKLKAKQLWAGPNIAVVPEEEGGVLLSDAIDRVLVPSQWVAALYTDLHPALKNKIHIWPVGIDTDYWEPGRDDKKQLLIFNKAQDPLSSDIARRLTAEGVPFKIIRYGSYAPQEYRAALAAAWGMVWLSSSESQGLSVLEALSMNVPVLAWNPGEWSFTSAPLKRSFSHAATSTPYFDARCGEQFKSLDQWQEVFRIFRDRLEHYRPREFIFESHLDLASNLHHWKVLNP